jgi:hypothetical protein
VTVFINVLAVGAAHASGHSPERLFSKTSQKATGGQRALGACLQLTATHQLSQACPNQ